MRLLYIVQRYGLEVAGGAERHCREFATRLAARGHEVHALTSRAVNHATWANHYPQGDCEIDGVTVHRLSASRERDERFFSPLNSRAIWGHRPVPFHLQRYWLEQQGPLLPDLVPWLEEQAASYDAVVFFTYLYYPTWAGLPVASRLAPTVLHPTAHDEPALMAPIFDLTLRHPHAFAFSTEEEAALLTRRAPFVAGPWQAERRSAIIGVGVELDRAGPDDVAAFRADHGLGDAPYLAYVGRVEPGKGSVELWELFTAYKERNPGPLKLVVVGTVVNDLASHPDVIFTGFVEERAKRAALAGALALAQPSFFESFSMVLTEAWAQGTAALVQGLCEVLVGQSRRAGAGLPYCGFAEFEAAVDRLLADPGLRAAMGAAGRRYVEERYSWAAVMERYERFLTSVASRAHGRSRPVPVLE